MKKLALAFTSALTAAVASGAEPVAVWNGNFSDNVLEQGGCTLVLNGNSRSQDRSSITIDQAVRGVDVDIASPLANGITVLVRYSGLEPGAKAKMLVTSCVDSSHGYDRTGVDLQAGGQLYGAWLNDSHVWADNGTLSGSVGADGFMAFTYKGGVGTYLYKSSGGAFEEAWGSSGLQSSYDSGIYGATVGGMRYANANWTAATNMTISAVAVFDGAMTAAEIGEWRFADVASDTLVSELNTELGSADKVLLRLAPGVKITIDDDFAASCVRVSSTGSVSLEADAAPDAQELSKFDFSCVSGGVLRSWLTPGVVGYNFRSGAGSDTSAALVSGGTWLSSEDSYSGSTAAMFTDGLSVFAWSSANTWIDGGGTFMSGYLDDGANGGDGAAITLSNVPYETYDVVIYAATDSRDKFLAKTVNGKKYTWDATKGEVAEGTASWGNAGQQSVLYGQNAMRVRNLSGPLSITGGARNGEIRGCIAAVQIMPAGTPDNVVKYRLALNGAATKWSEGAWTSGGVSVAAPASGDVEIAASASTALTVDMAVSLDSLVVSGAVDAVTAVAAGSGGSLVAGSVRIAGGVLQQGSAAALGATPTVVVNDGATLDVNGLAVDAATSLVLAGAGAGSWPWALTSSGGASGEILSLSLSADATIGGANEIKLGKTQNGYNLYLEGHTLSKTGPGALTCTNLRTHNGGGLDLREGVTSFNQWTSLDGSETIDRHTTVTVREGAELRNNTTRRLWIDTINAFGGVVTTTDSGWFGISSAFAGSCTTTRLEFNDGATATLSGDLEVTGSLSCGALSLVKSNGVESASATVSGTLSAAGAISVGDGVTLNLGLNRPDSAISVSEGGTLSVAQADSADIPVVRVTARPASVVLYDAAGDRVQNVKVEYDADAGTIAVMPALPTWRHVADWSFDNEANWDGSVRPAPGDSAIVEVDGDATLSVASAYAVDALVVVGAGSLAFSGDGTISAAAVRVSTGSSLVRNGQVVETESIGLSAGSVLRLDAGGDNLVESAQISGDGSVVAVGNVTMATNNLFTGGITATGGVLSTRKSMGFGPYYVGAALSDLSRITVEDGACLDLANTVNYSYAITAAGRGVPVGDGSYSGAIVNSGSAMGYGARQTASLTLSADATVTMGADAGWGLVQSSHGPASLALNGHTLTMQGGGTAPFVNVNTSAGAATEGTIVLDGVTLQLAAVASDLTGVDVVAKGGSKLDFAVAPSAIGSLTLAPGASAPVSAPDHWNLPEGLTVAVNSADIDFEAVEGASLTLFSAPVGVSLSDDGFSYNMSSRYTARASGNSVVATVLSAAIPKYLHYVFNGGEVSVAGQLAGDSENRIHSWGEAGSSPLFAGSRNGGCIRVKSSDGDDNFTPYWNKYSGLDGSDVDSPYGAGEMTVTTVARMIEADNTTLWGLGSAAGGVAVGLVAVDTNTVSVVTKDATGAVSTLATVSGHRDLTQGSHFYAVVLSARGTRLYVDERSDSSSATVPLSLGQQGQLGSFHGGAAYLGVNMVGAEGFWLDDWAVYGAALTPSEVTALRKGLCPVPTFMFLR